jgi:hypothetical protein
MAVKPNGSDYLRAGHTRYPDALKDGKGLGKRYDGIQPRLDGTIQLLYPLSTDGEGLLPDAD